MAQSPGAEITVRSADSLRVAIAQISPVWLSRDRTVAKVADFCRQAADDSCQLVVFGEALIPGYPFWLDRTDGARFDSPLQKRWHAHYLQEAVQLERGDLEPIQSIARESQLAVMVGCVERPSDRGGHSLYCTLVYIDPLGVIQSAHRKLMPTYEERLAWAAGDGHGLRVHELGPFLLGGLNCWENWMPLARAALYGFGEDLHVAIWPGSRRHTEGITPFLAREGRSYVISVSGLLRAEDIHDDVPEANELRAAFDSVMADGGSCLAGPDGRWVIEPATHDETLLVADLDHAVVRGERQNFDPAGHYSRPDVLRLEVNRWRQSTSRESEVAARIAPDESVLPTAGTGMPPLEKFTHRGKLIATLALEAARETAQLEVLPEHVLLALLSEGSGVAAGALGCLGLSYERLYPAVKERGMATMVTSGCEPVFSANTLEVLSRAALEAQVLGHRFAGSEHLLMALCKIQEDRLTEVLHAVDLTREAIRAEIDAIMRHGT